MLWKLLGSQFAVKDRRRFSSLLFPWPKHIAEVCSAGQNFPLVGVHTNLAISGYLHMLVYSHFILTFLWKTMCIFPLQRISKKIRQQNIDREILHASVRKLKPRIPSELRSVQLCCCFVLQGWLRVAVGISSLEFPDLHACNINEIFWWKSSFYISDLFRCTSWWIKTAITAAAWISCNTTCLDALSYFSVCSQREQSQALCWFFMKVQS